MRRAVNAAVLFLIALVVGAMIFPTILRAREAANRTHCANNLRSMDLAVHNFHDTFGRFPYATVRCPTLVPEERLSWYVDLMPFVEQEGMEFDKNKVWSCPENIRPKCHGVGTPVFEGVAVNVINRCPSNPNQSEEIPNPTHYVGITGLGDNAAELDKDYPGVGILGYDRKVKFEDITDGTSTTMLVAETGWKNGPWTAGGFPTARGLLSNGLPYLGKNGQFTSVHRTGGIFSSGSMVTNVLFADGSVRPLGESVGARTFEALATIAGRETVDLPDMESCR
jgi:prepilin-type processing-associated H-X9-DG protein